MTAPTTEKPDTSLHGPNLILDVENFGPIAEAKNIEFKPMTVFLGPSNTGKTYLAMLYQSFLKTAENDWTAFRRPLSSAILSTIFRNSTETAVLGDDISDRIKSQFAATDHDYLSQEFRIPPSSLSVASNQFVQRIIREWASVYGRNVNRTIQDQFSVDNVEYLHTATSDLNRPLRIRLHDSLQRFAVILPGDDSTVSPHEFPLVFRSDLAELYKLTAAPTSTDDQDEVRQSFNLEIAFALTKGLTNHLACFADSVYFPASRTGIIANRRLLTSNRLSEAPDTILNDDGLSELNAVNRHFLLLLLGMRDDDELQRSGHVNRGHDFAKMHQLAKIFETSVIDGSIKVVDSGVGASNMRYLHYDVETPLERSSAMVTEIASLVMFLRNYAETGDLLIIDEPEAHLHPEAQQQMAAALAFMVRSGLRVLITTHSHYMVEQLSNFVMATRVDDLNERKRLLGIKGSLGEEDIHLKPHEIAVYDFAPQSPKGGSVVKEVPFEDGYYPEDHMRAISAQFNRNNRIESAFLDNE